MSDTSDLLEGIARMIATAGIGVSYNKDGWYVGSTTGVYMKTTPDKPDRAVVLNSVNQGDDITMPLGEVMVQVKGRGAANRPLDVDDLLDDIFAILHGTTGLAFGGIIVIQMNRRVSVPMGRDDNNRWSRIDQYYLDVEATPTSNRPIGGSW